MLSRFLWVVSAFITLAAMALAAEEPQTFALHHSVRALAFSPNGKYLAAGGRDRFVKSWDLMTGKKTTLMSHANVVDGLLFSSDGKSLASLGHQPIAQRRRGDLPSVVIGCDAALDRFALEGSETWDRQPIYFAGTPLLVTPLKEKILVVTRQGVDLVDWSGRKSSFHPKYQRVIAASGKMPDEVWSVGMRSNGKPNRLLGGPIPLPVEDLFWRLERWVVGSPGEPTESYSLATDGLRSLSIIAGANPVLVAIGPKDRLQIGRVIDSVVDWQTLTKTATVLAVSTDGTLFATGGKDKTVTLWSLPEAKELQSFALPEPATALSFSPDGRRLASGDEKGTVRVMEVQ